MRGSLACRLGFHIPMYWSKGDAAFHYYEPIRYDRVKCSSCGAELRKSKKQLKLEAEIDKEVKRIREEIEEYGHPLLKGVTSA